jgi:sugar phosphate isomerase/epimerase
MSNLRVGLHLYTVRDDLKADYRGTLIRAATIGYPAISGYGDLGGMTPGHFRTFAAETGLVPVAGAIDFAAAVKDPAAALAPHAAVGAVAACVMWLDEAHRKTAADVSRTAERFNEIGKAARKLGLVFQYHNHAFEFEAVEGRTIMDRLVEATDPALVGFQLDVGWVIRAGQDPAAWLRKLKGRVPTIHLKDTTGGASPTWTEIGNGVLDLPAVRAASVDAGVKWWLVEQDTCARSPMESAAISFRNASALLG